jgi:hypothetical protein
MNIRGGLNRIFVLLWVAWAAYAIVIYPAQLAEEHQDVWYTSVTTCTETKMREGLSWKEAHEPCLKENQALWDEGVRLYSLPGRSAEAWFTSVLFALIPPPIVYLGILAAARIIRWVWQGFKVSH